MSEAPDWVTSIPNLASIHTMPTTAGEGGVIGLSQQQLIQWGRNLIEGVVREVVLAVAGVLLPGPAGQQLATWALGLLDNFDSIFGAFDGIDLNDPGAVLAAIQEAITNIVADLFNGDLAVNVLNLFGNLPASLFGLIPSSALTGGSPNLLSNPGFDGSGSVSGSSIWAWDGTVGHTSLGSVKVTANATLKALLSNPIDVTAGQVLSPSVWVLTSGYTGSGTPLRLGVRTYNAGSPVATATVASAAGTGSWAQLSGSYTVPASGVDQVRLRLVVDTTATGGSVWFDDASVTKPGNGPFDGILDLFNLGSFDDLFNLNPATIWAAVINVIFNPLGLLAPLVGGVLPDANRPQMLQDLVDNVVDVFSTGVQGSSSGNNLVTAFLSLLGIHRTGTGAQSQNVVQDSQIGSLLSGGSGLFDTFDGASATSLPSTPWEQTYFGSGAGTCGLSGAGSCTWATSGASVRGCLNRYKTALTTDTQLVSMTLAANLAGSFIGQHPEIRLQGRMNSAHDTYVEARVNLGQAEIGYVVSGTYTRLGSTQSISGDTSGTWSLKLGTVSSNREFLLLRNNVTVMTRTDSGASSQMGASYRYTGFSDVAGVQYLGGFLFFQMAPPDIESFGASDRLAAL